MKLFYKILSAIFQPFLMPTFTMIWLMTTPILSQILPIQYKITAIALTAFFTGMMPLFAIFMLMKQGQVSDINISDQKQRTIPYLFAFLAYMFWWVFLWRTLRMPAFISSVAIASAISLIIIMLINLKWKISAHLCSIGGAFAFVVGVSYHFALNPVLLIIVLLIITALVAIARVELKQHTVTQTLAGFAVGFVCVIIPTVLINF